MADKGMVICRNCGEEVHEDRALPVIPDEFGNMTYRCEDCLEPLSQEKLERMRKEGFKEEVEAIKKGLCPFCKKPVKESDFKGYRSRLDFRVNGSCKACQDDFYRGLFNQET